MTATLDIELMRVALELAEAAGAAGEVPVGAVLAHGGKIVASAGNAPIGCADPAAHAEVLTLRAAGRSLGNYRMPGTTMYVTLEPCPMCAGALVHARVERLVYGAPDPKGGACGSLMDLTRDLRLNHQLAVEGGVLAEEASALLKDFFRARR